MTSSESDRAWHLDKRIPVAIIITLLAQFGGAIWFFSQLDGRVYRLEQSGASRQDERDRIIRLEAGLAGIKEYLQRIDQKIDRLDNTAQAR